MSNPPNDTFRGLLFPVDGIVVPVAIRPGRFLNDLYRAIRGTMVEVVSLEEGINLWCDEEALLHDSVRPNRVWALRRCAEAHALFGNVVALGSTDGAARSLTVEEAVLALVRVIAVSSEIAATRDRQPTRDALARWLIDGIDWRN